MTKGTGKWYFFRYGKEQYKRSNQMHVLRHDSLHNNLHLVEEFY